MVELKRHVALVGFMGAGKSTIGPRLARKLLRPFVDTDTEIVSGHGPIPLIFAERGEQAFREFEREAIERAVAGPPSVMALGGGALTQAPVRDLVAQYCVRVYLSASPGTIFHRIGASKARPMLGDSPSRERIAALLDLRGAHYRESEIVVRVDGRRPNDIVEEIASRLDG